MAKVALEAIREDVTMAEYSKKYGVYQRAAVKNMAAGFSKRGRDPAQADDTAIDKLHSIIHREGTIGQVVPLWGKHPCQPMGAERFFRTELEKQSIQVMAYPVGAI